MRLWNFSLLSFTSWNVILQFDIDSKSFRIHFIWNAFCTYTYCSKYAKAIGNRIHLSISILRVRQLKEVCTKEFDGSSLKEQIDNNYIFLRSWIFYFLECGVYDLA